MASKPPSLVPYNAVGAQCILTPADSCLYQVAGYSDNNPIDQLSACQAVIGFPSVPTVTLSADRVFSTDIATVIYTDIITSTNTLQLTTTETLTNTVTVSETDTQFTTTLVNTVSTTDAVTVTTRVPVAATTTVPPAKLRRRGGCRGRTSSSLPASAVASSAAPSSSAASAPAPSTTDDVLPLASNCPNEAAYSSACSCLVLPAATEVSDPITSVIRQTETSTVTSTSYATSIEMITQTAWADDTVTATATATEYTNTQTTTTATTTTTTTVQPPVPTDFVIKTNESPSRNLYMSGNGVIYSALLSPLPGLTTPVKIASPNSQPTNKWSTAWAMYAHAVTGGLYEIVFTTPQGIAASGGTFAPVICAVDEQTLLVKCMTSSSPNLVKIMACGDKTYLTAAGFTAPSNCGFVQFYAAE